MDLLKKKSTLDMKRDVLVTMKSNAERMIEYYSKAKKGFKGRWEKYKWQKRLDYWTNALNDFDKKHKITLQQ